MVALCVCVVVEWSKCAVMRLTLCHDTGSMGGKPTDDIAGEGLYTETTRT